jgi:hypothetical protein
LESAACASGTVTMTQAMTCTATFETTSTNPTLIVQRAGSGTGTVASAPPGIDCGAVCSATFAPNTRVTLTATPGPDSSFAGWSPAACASGSVVITQTLTCVATFGSTSPMRRLTVTLTGGGRVTSMPAGIACGQTCAGDFSDGTVVRLIPIPNDGQTLQGWGGACSGAGSCRVHVNGPRSVTAAFAPGGGVPITVTSVTPRAGIAEGGTKLRIVGTGFNQPGPAFNVAGHVSVVVGGVPAIAVDVISDSLIVAVTGAATSSAPGVAAPVATPGQPGNLVVNVAGRVAVLASAWQAVFLDGSPGTDTDGDGMTDQYEALYSLDILTPDGGLDPDEDGATNLEESRAGTHPQGYHRRYMAEGATSAFFDTRIAVANPRTVPATTLFTFTTESQALPQMLTTVPGEERRLIYPRNLPPLAAANFGTVVESDLELVVDRQMFWDQSLYGTHAETSVAAPGTTWYLAEGATHGRFELFYLLQNPSPSAAEVQIRFLRPAAPPLVRTYTLPARQRLNVLVDRIPELEATDVSAVIESVNGVPIIVERAMYVTADSGRPFEGGHNSAAVPAPSTSWFLAEGATGNFFDTFILMANPYPAAAEVTARYLLPGGGVVTKTYQIAPNSRRTIWVDGEDPALAATSVSTVVESTNGVPIIVERSMWWPGPEWVAANPSHYPGFWSEAHNSFGSTETGTKWAVADGTTGPEPVFTRTYYLIANTSPFAASIKVTLLSEYGLPPISRVFPVPAHGRFTVDVGTEFPEAHDMNAFGGYGGIVESLSSPANPAAEIVVERAIYMNSADGVFWSAGSNVLATKLR